MEEMLITSSPRDVIIKTCLIITTLLSVLTIVAYFFGDWALVTFGSGYVPMAPLTAIVFLLFTLLLAIFLLLPSLLSGDENPVRRTAILSLLGGILILCFYILIRGFFPLLPDIEEDLFAIPDMISGIPVGNMSPATAGIFILCSLSLICSISESRKIKNLSPILGAGVLSLGLFILTAYWYQSPFLYGGGEIPVSLATALCFFLLGYALMIHGKGGTHFDEYLFGDCVRAQLLRAFLPVMLIFMIIEGWIYSVINREVFVVNPAAWSATISFISILVIVFITTILSRQIGGEIEKVQHDRDNYYHDLSRVHQKLISAFDKLSIQDAQLQKSLNKLSEREKELELINYELIENKKIIEENESRYRELFDHISSGVVVYEALKGGQDFIIQDMNRAGERIDKMQREEIIGRSVREIYPAISEFGLFDLFVQVYGDGIPRTHPVSFYEDDRISGWRENYIYRLTSGEIVAVYDDVTEKKQDEEALRTSEEKFRIIADYTYDWEIWQNPEGEGVYVSPSSVRITGYTPDEFMKDPCLFNNIIHPEDRGLWDTHLLEATTSEITESVIFRIIHRSGDIRWIKHICRPIILSSGKYLGRRGSNRDITSEKEVEGQIRVAIERITQNMATFATLNDEIRNPLTVISFLSDNTDLEINLQIHQQIELINDLIDQLDRGYLESEKVRLFLQKHYQIFLE